MNQILNFIELPSQNTSPHKNAKLFFYLLFTFCIISITIIVIYYFYKFYTYKINEEFSNKLVDDFKIATLYNTNSSFQNSTIYLKTDSLYSIIGTIEIPSLKINYPIIDNFTYENLKIAPCKFYGPLPNEKGNLCIVGHNYNNYKFFSKIKDLKINDEIIIYDLNGKKLTYHVYKNYEINSNDFSCINQNTNANYEITLITCSTPRTNRRIIKAIAK